MDWGFIAVVGVASVALAYWCIGEYFGDFN
jgi:hypothetical protein